MIGDFQNGDADIGRNLGGFWIQEQDVNVDGVEATSEGIFVADSDLTDALFVDVNVGDQVIVTGVVEENFDQTQIRALSVEIVDSGNELPAPRVIEFPLSPGDLEAHEGMYVTFPQELMITGMLYLSL